MTMTIPSDRHFLPVSDLLSAGFSYYRIKKLVEEGKLIKLNNKMYENMGLRMIRCGNQDGMRS